MDARRHSRADPRRTRARARRAALDRATPGTRASERGGRADGAGPAAGARARGGARRPRAALRLESARSGPDRPGLRPLRPLLRRAHRRTRHAADRRSAGVRCGRASRARAHPQPGRGHDLHHARDLVRVPRHHGRPVRADAPRRRGGDDRACVLEARRTGAPRLPHPECRAALARGLCRCARLDPRRPRRGFASPAGGAAGARRRLGRAPSAAPSRSRSPPSGAR